MNRPKRLLVANVAWARETAARDPAFFRRLAQRQNPSVLWIGCSDSRVEVRHQVHAQARGWPMRWPVAKSQRGHG